MPYRVGGKGDTAGCSGYAVVDESGKTVGCHSSRAQADDQLQALYANVPDAEKSEVAGANPSFTVDPKYPGVGIKRPEQGRRGGTPGRSAIGSKPAPKPKNVRYGRHSNASGASSGGTSSGGSGGSIG
jgi:hypothetical protein